MKGLSELLERFYHVNICVSDMDRALEFYTALGFTVETDVNPRGEDIASHLGLTCRALRAVILRFPQQNGPMIDLVQFIDPPAEGAPYPSLANLGIARLSFWTEDFDAVLGHIGDAALETFGPDATYPSPTGDVLRTVIVKDPDGTAVQFIGAAA
jgi:catechol 2,3-dioxygenase-like lactoylglutathione lyase family enzyme